LWTNPDQKNSGTITLVGAAPVNNNLIGATKPTGVTYELRTRTPSPSAFVRSASST
jgi:hypothetical protein